jgi:glutaryl-CoA dehydrogenase
VQDTVARFTDERVIPIIGDCLRPGRFPKELIPEIAEMGLLGSSLPRNTAAPASTGQLRPDLPGTGTRRFSGIRSFVSVQSSLCMYPIYAYGTRSSACAGCRDMAAGKVIGCFGLTEPQGGSDPANMKTRAVRDGGDWIINGSKMWITNGNLADIAIVWAQTDDGIQGFLVEKGTPASPRRKSTRR